MTVREQVRFLGRLFSRTFDRFIDLEGLRLGAAFSYYATFAIFPLVLLTVTVVGFVIGDDAPTRERVISALGGADESVKKVIEQTLVSMQHSHGARKTSAVIGIVTLLLSASGAFTEVDFALNKIWNVKPRSSKGILGTVKAFLDERLVGFACVAGIGVFLLASLMLSATLSAIAAHVHLPVTPALLQTAELVLSMALVCAALTAAFHFVPRSRPPLRDVIGGAVLTTVLLTLLKALFAFFLAHLTSYSAYGIVGGVLALATWIYVTSQIIFFGAVLTRVHGEMLDAPDESVHGTLTHRASV